jgi:hypothetical protein
MVVLEGGWLSVRRWEDSHVNLVVGHFSKPFITPFTRFPLSRLLELIRQQNSFRAHSAVLTAPEISRLDHRLVTGGLYELCRLHFLELMWRDYLCRTKTGWCPIYSPIQRLFQIIRSECNRLDSLVDLIRLKDLDQVWFCFDDFRLVSWGFERATSGCRQTIKTWQLATAVHLLGCQKPLLEWLLLHVLCAVLSCAKLTLLFLCFLIYLLINRLSDRFWVHRLQKRVVIRIVKQRSPISLWPIPCLVFKRVTFLDDMLALRC